MSREVSVSFQGPYRLLGLVPYMYVVCHPAGGAHGTTLLVTDSFVFRGSWLWASVQVHWKRQLQQSSGHQQSHDGSAAGTHFTSCKPGLHSMQADQS